MLGGVAVAVTVFAGGLTLPLSATALLMSAGGLIFLVGLIDDLLRLSPTTKLTASIAVASLLVFFGLQ